MIVEYVLVKVIVWLHKLDSLHGITNKAYIATRRWVGGCKRCLECSSRGTLKNAY